MKKEVPACQNWQLVQSSSTSVENLEHDFNEIVAKIRELGWSEGKRVTSCCVEEGEEPLRGMTAAGQYVLSRCGPLYLKASQSSKDCVSFEWRALSF